MSVPITCPPKVAATVSADARARPSEWGATCESIASRAGVAKAPIVLMANMSAVAVKKLRA